MLDIVSTEAQREATMANTVTQELQDQFLSTVRKSQEIALEAIRTMVDTIQNITPKIPSVDVPFSDKLPTPHDVVASGYDFAEKLLTSQRQFAAVPERRSCRALCCALPFPKTRPTGPEDATHRSRRRDPPVAGTRWSPYASAAARASRPSSSGSDQNPA